MKSVVALCIIAALSAAPPTADAQAVERHAWTALGPVAHGGGGVDGIDTTNSYEAMVTNYGLGYRVFEFDLNLTTDGRLAAVHDWSLFSGQKTLAQYKALTIYDHYTAMGLEDILEFMQQKPDAYLITDTKSFEYTEEQTEQQFRIIYEAAAARDPRLLDRIVPQIYDQRMYETVRKVYPFESVIYTLYATRDTNRQVLDFVKDREDIKVVTMAPERLSEDFVQQLSAQGKLVYLFTINDPVAADGYMQRGVHGIYTDFIAP